MPSLPVVTRLDVPCHGLSRTYTAAVVADLHSHDGTGALQILTETAPDLILAAGDICEDLTGKVSPRDPGLRFLTLAAQLAPVFYAPGNHEYGCHDGPFRKRKDLPAALSPDARAAVRESGVRLLEDEFCLYGNFCIAGLCTGLRNPNGYPHVDFLQYVEGQPGCRILLCHHPEYYPFYLAKKPFDLIVSGHAHGGQWRFFGRGVFAPGQGLFPYYTHGLYDGHFAVSAGLSNTAPVPRIANPCEVLLLTLRPEKRS